MFGSSRVEWLVGSVICPHSLSLDVSASPRRLVARVRTPAELMVEHSLCWGAARDKHPSSVLRAAGTWQRKDGLNNRKSLCFSESETKDAAPARPFLVTSKQVSDFIRGLRNSRGRVTLELSRSEQCRGPVAINRENRHACPRSRKWAFMIVAEFPGPAVGN